VLRFETDVTAGAITDLVGDAEDGVVPEARHGVRRLLVLLEAIDLEGLVHQRLEPLVRQVRHA
jgi:hypothetical protein